MDAHKVVLDGIQHGVVSRQPVPVEPLPVSRQPHGMLVRSGELVKLILDTLRGSFSSGLSSHKSLNPVVRSNSFITSNLSSPYEKPRVAFYFAEK